MTDAARPRRPRFVAPATLEALGERVDPIGALHAAHETAAVLVHAGRAADDPSVTARLVALVDDIGLSTLADLWAERPAVSLPGALWRLYVLREWVSTNPEQASREYAAGVRFAEPQHVVAGAEPPGPDEVRATADAILRGLFAGDVAVALERAAAFCHVVAAGRAAVVDGYPELVRAGKLQAMASDLTACAAAWRTGELI